MARPIEIVAEFRKERQCFQNDDSRVIIGEAIHECDAIDDTLAQDEFGEQWQSAPAITIKGEAEERQLRPGLTYRFYGHWFEHHRYGRQFAFTAFILEEPATENAVVCYLQLCRGIGPGTAQKMFDLYGSDAIKTLREDPERVAAEVKSMTPEKAAEAAHKLKSMQGTERAKAEMMGLLDGRGFPKKTVQLCIDDYGSAAAAVIRRNPYLLMQYRGCGFLKTDKMYLELGLPPDRLKRQALCAWHAIARDSEGHTWFPASVATGAIARTVSGARLNPERAAELAVRAKYLTRRTDANGCVWIAEHAKAYAEERIVNAIEAAELETPAWPTCDQMDATLSSMSDHQREELSKALRGMICILGGAPGTGKTFTAAAVVRTIIETVGAEHVAAACPTGKAAVRLTEALQANDIDLQATTIHRLLVVESSKGGFSFKFNKANPLPERFVLLDESSMDDSGLMASLLDARGMGTHFLFLGDINQLAPVGHGAPLRDMIAAGLPAGDLREIRRNSGRIVQACADIRDRRRFIPSPEMDLENGENLLHVETSGATGTLETLQRFYTSIENSDEYDPIWSVQVLCAVNKKSPLGRRELNSMLQGMLNPMGQQASGNRFRVGDKVINLKNGWFSAVDPKHPDCNQQGKLYVANGEIGEAVEVEPRRTICRLSDPPRLVIIPHGSPKGGGSEDTGSENEDDRVGKDNAKDDDDTGTGSTWDLAYSISTHKCVSPDTLVETSEGIQPIREIAESGRIAAMNGMAEYRGLFSLPHAECRKITTEDGHDITVSVDHKCEVWNGESWVLVPADRLEIGQFVRQRLGFVFDNGRHVILPESHADSRSASVSIPRILTAQVSEFFGLVVADGTVYKSGVRLAKAQKETVERFSDLAGELFGIYPALVYTPGKDTGFWTADVHSCVVADWLRSIGGMCPRAKAVPSCVMRSSLCMHSAFLRGLFEDGSVHVKDGKLDHINWTTSSPAMMKVVRILLLRLNIVCSVNSQNKSQSSLYIYGADTKRFASVIGLIADEKTRRLQLPTYGNSESSRKRIPINKASIRDVCAASVGKSNKNNAINRGYVSRATACKFPDESLGVNADWKHWHYSRIESIESTSGPVMCVEVPSQGRFLQNGFPWSNSQGSEFPVAIVILDEHSGAQRVCTRNWLFTAISRAKKLCVTIGPQRLAQAMCQKDGLRRKTFLVERIHERLPKLKPEPVQVQQVQPVQPVQVQRQATAAAAITDDRFRALFAGAK